jgi:serine/threonine-protein kinase
MQPTAIALARIPSDLTTTGPLPPPDLVASAAMGEALGPGRVLAGTYEIVRLVGQGGMGAVYEARHRRLAGRCAVKILKAEVGDRPEIFARFRREAEITSALRHPNIVQVLDFDTTADGHPFLVMEFLEGRELTTEIARVGRLPLPRAIDLVGQIADGLSAAHSRKIVHRDLKPQNVFLVRPPGEEREIAKIVDFGISKVREATTKLTEESVLLGTPQYMSPEQALGRTGEIDERTDQFALGAIAYELLTGREAFRADAVTAVLYQIVHEPPPPMRAANPEITAAVEAAVLRALAKRPALRFPDVRAFHRALAEAAGAVRAGAAPASRPAARAPLHEAATTEGATTEGATTEGATTIDGARGELAPARPGALRRYGLPALKLAGVAAIGAAAVAALLAPGGTKRRPALQAAGPPLAAPAQRGDVLVNVDRAPPGLRVTLDGAPVSLPISVPRGSGIHRLTFEAPGHEPWSTEIDAGVDLRLDLAATMRRSRAPGRRGGRTAPGKASPRAAAAPAAAPAPEPPDDLPPQRPRPRGGLILEP